MTPLPDSTTSLIRTQGRWGRVLLIWGFAIALSIGAFRLSALISSRAVMAQSGAEEVRLLGAGVGLGGLLFRPASTTAQASPALIVLHGWGPPGVAGAPRVAGFARALAGEGYVVLAPSMRGWPPSEGQDDCGLRQPDDIVAALDWLSSRLGVDPDHIGLVGFSQGGQVVLLVAARTTRVRAVVAYYPVTDIDKWQETTTFSGIRNDYIPHVCAPGGTRLRSPVDVAAKIAAPVLLIHGRADTRVPTDQSIMMARALQTAGNQAILELIPNEQHGFSPAGQAAAWRAVVAFLAQHLKPH